MTTLRSVALYLVAAVAETGGAYLVWQGVREQHGWVPVQLGALALTAYGFVAAFQPDPRVGHILTTYGAVFVAGSLAWGVRRIPSGQLGSGRCRPSACAASR